MGEIAFVFSGQGDQFPGMGKEIAERYPAAAEVMEFCDSMRPGTSEQCFSGTEEELKQTVNTQPCLYAVEMAAAAALTSLGIRPAAAAGFSLGEVTACVYAGAMDRESGFRLICGRGRLMQEASDAQDTFMAAVLKLDEDMIGKICGRLDEVYPVNYNCPGQIVVSGRSDQLPLLSEAVRAAGGRVMPLKVSGAFHSPFMEKATDAFYGELQKVPFKRPVIPVYSNVTAQLYGSDFAGLLSRQICSPVRWEQLIRNMIGTGIDTFIEIGPGRTLTGLIRKIDRSVRTFAVCSISEIEEAVQAQILCNKE